MPLKNEIFEGIAAYKALAPTSRDQYYDEMVKEKRRTNRQDEEADRAAKTGTEDFIRRKTAPGRRMVPTTASTAMPGTITNQAAPQAAPGVTDFAAQPLAFNPDNPIQRFNRGGRVQRFAEGGEVAATARTQNDLTTYEEEVDRLVLEQIGGPSDAGPLPRMLEGAVPREIEEPPGHAFEWWKEGEKEKSRRQQLQHAPQALQPAPPPEKRSLIGRVAKRVGDYINADPEKYPERAAQIARWDRRGQVRPGVFEQLDDNELAEREAELEELRKRDDARRTDYSSVGAVVAGEPPPKSTSLAATPAAPTEQPKPAQTSPTASVSPETQQALKPDTMPELAPGASAGTPQAPSFAVNGTAPQAGVPVPQFATGVGPEVGALQTGAPPPVPPAKPAATTTTPPPASSNGGATTTPPPASSNGGATTTSGGSSTPGGAPGTTVAPPPGAGAANAPTQARKGLTDPTRVDAYDPTNQQDASQARARGSYQQQVMTVMAGALQHAPPGVVTDMTKVPLGEGAPSREAFQQFVAANNPGGYTPGQAAMAGMIARYQVLLSQGRVEEAGKMAWGLIQAANLEAAALARTAGDAMRSGDTRGATNLIAQGLDYLPDGVNHKASPDGRFIITSNEQGQVTGQTPVTPQLIMALVTGIGDGSMMWQALQQSVASWLAMKREPDRDAEGRALRNQATRNQLELQRQRIAKGNQPRGGGQQTSDVMKEIRAIDAQISGVPAVPAVPQVPGTQTAQSEVDPDDYDRGVA